MELNHFGAPYRIQDLMGRWRAIEVIEPDRPPEYHHHDGPVRLVFGVESMRRHITDEGWQLQDGLEHVGYLGVGDQMSLDLTDVRESLSLFGSNVSVAVMQDKREWDRERDSCFEPQSHFENSAALAEHPEIFKLTVLKDHHADPQYHQKAAREIGCHAWLHYYHPTIASGLARWLRPQHMIRTYHTINRDELPPWRTAEERCGAILSGAMLKRYYPLRVRIRRNIFRIPHGFVTGHPGYNANGCRTPTYLAMLSRYRIAFCTASVFGYSLRKLTEATAVGCVVITDLPQDDVIPAIDQNLVRIHPDISIDELAELVGSLHAHYDEERQRELARLAIERYDYRLEGLRLSREIERMRKNYVGTAGSSLS